MQIVDFFLYHSHDPKADARTFASSFFVLQTCQRSFAVGMTGVKAPGWEEYRGQHAYRFLLQILAGLESRVLGETEVFGQFKDAWSAVDTTSPVHAHLQPILQKVLTDVKRIRKDHLQNIGNSSYGSLTRRLVGDVGQLTVMGAGQLAQSIVPYLSHAQVHCWNRTPSRVESLRAHLPTLLHLADPFEPQHWQRCDAVVLCTPVDHALESRLIPYVAGKKVLHLGARQHETKHWRDHADFAHLDDLFALQQEMNDLKNERIKKARSACERCAEYRYFMDGITFHHGWEDIVAFS